MLFRKKIPVYLGPPIILRRSWPCCTPCCSPCLPPVQAYGCIGGQSANSLLAAQLSFGGNYGGPQLIYLNGGLQSLNGLCGRC